MKSLSPLVGIVYAWPPRSLVVLTLLPLVLTGCSGAGLQSSGLAGPSWQQREAVHLQEGEEEGDLGDRLRKAEEESSGERRAKKWRSRLLGVLLVGATMAILVAVDDEDDGDYDLAFDLPQTTESIPAEAPLRYRQAVKPKL